MGYVHDSKFSRSDDEYAIREDLFEAVDKARNEFNTEFKSCYSDLKKINDDMKKSKAFNDELTRGFMETFNILLLYQEDLIKLLPDLYKSFSDFDEEIQKIEGKFIYTELIN